MFTAVVGLRSPAHGSLADSRASFSSFLWIDAHHGAAVHTSPVVGRLASANVSTFVVWLIKIRQTASRYKETPQWGTHPDGENKSEL